MNKSIYSPHPDTAALIRSQSLCDLLHKQISQHGPISFAQFMQHALYHPLYGYYCADTLRFGKHGDFTTAPEISPLFAACFAKQCASYLASNPSPILELGAGSGKFAYDLLSQLIHLKTLPTHYYIYEISRTLRQQQKSFVQTHAPHLLQHITWLTALPNTFSGIIIANEVLDALPFHCFSIQNRRILEKRVTLENNQLQWQLATPADEALITQIKKIQSTITLSHGYESEVSLQAPALIYSLADMLTRGIILLADYGYGQEEYYHPERCHGTLTCFYQHQRNDNPLQWPGLQDITAHVNFTQIAQAAVDKNCTIAGYTTQASFLLANDLMELIQTAEAQLQQAEKFALHQAVKRLTFPTEMGERIKIMALTKEVDMPLVGFSWHDRRRDL